MKFFIKIFLLLLWNNISYGQLSFCGEHVPVEDMAVSKKLEKAKKTMIANYFKGHDLDRTKKYLDYFSYELNNAGIPDDFKYLPIVESLLKNRVSRVGASGYWQLMPATAKELNLEVNSSADERFNVVYSTGAAVDYLKWLYKKTNSWTLAAAAYNCGTGNVNKAQRKAGKKQYYYLPLPAETKDYVYRIIACKEIYEKLTGEKEIVDTTVIVKAAGTVPLLEANFKEPVVQPVALKQIFKCEAQQDKYLQNKASFPVRILTKIDSLNIEKYDIKETAIVNNEGVIYFTFSSYGKIFMARICDAQGNYINKNILIEGEKYYLTIEKSI